MEMKYIVGLILLLIVLFVSLVIIGKNAGIMSGLFEGLKSLFGL